MRSASMICMEMWGSGAGTGITNMMTTIRPTHWEQTLAFTGCFAAEAGPLPPDICVQRTGVVIIRVAGYLAWASASRVTRSNTEEFNHGVLHGVSQGKKGREKRRKTHLPLSFYNSVKLRGFYSVYLRGFFFGGITEASRTSPKSLYYNHAKQYQRNNQRENF